MKKSVVTEEQIETIRKQIKILEKQIADSFYSEKTKVALRESIEHKKSVISMLEKGI